MPVSAQQRLLRTLIAALKAVAAKYNVVLDGFQERTATDAAVRRAYKKVVRKAHPDKGGDAADFRTVHEAYEAWQVGPAPSTRGHAGTGRRQSSAGPSTA